MRRHSAVAKSRRKKSGFHSCHTLRHAGKTLEVRLETGGISMGKEDGVRAVQQHQPQFANGQGVMFVGVART